LISHAAVHSAVLQPVVHVCFVEWFVM